MPHWLTRGSAANLAHSRQQSFPPRGGSGPQPGALQGPATPPVTPQQVTFAIKQATTTPALQRINAALNGAAMPRWLTQGSAAGRVKGVQKTGTQQNGNGTPQTATPMVPKK